MAFKELILAFGLVAAAAPVSASREEPALTQPAPAGTPDTRYCMRIEAITGSRLEEIKCWTRDEWAERGVDLDREWAKEGVRTTG